MKERNDKMIIYTKDKEWLDLFLTTFTTPDTIVYQRTLDSGDVETLLENPAFGSPILESDLVKGKHFNDKVHQRLAEKQDYILILKSPTSRTDHVMRIDTKPQPDTVAMYKRILKRKEG